MNVCPRQREQHLHSPEMGLSGEQQGGQCMGSREEQRPQKEGLVTSLASHHRRMGFCSWHSSKVCLRYVPGWLASKSAALPESLLIYSASFYTRCPFLEILSAISSSVCNCEPCPLQSLVRGGRPATFRTEC